MIRPRHLLFCTQSAVLIAALCLSAARATAGSSEPQSETQPAANNVEKNLPKTQCWFGVAVENIPSAISRQLKLRKDQGLMILSVLQYSPAERAGLRAEDILIEVNDKPLTSQEELAHAANIVDVSPKGELHQRVAHITYLRDGDRTTIDIMPEPRPATMLVLGNNAGNFQATSASDATGSQQSRVRNYVLPNGAAAQVGPGYRIDPSSGDPAALSIKSIHSLVSKGQTVIVTQDTDAAGNSRRTITVGTTTYEVDKSKLASIPEDLRPLAEELLKAPATPAATVSPSGNGATPAAGDTAHESGLESRVRELEAQNHKLEQKLDAMLKLLQDKQSAPPAPTQEPSSK